MQPSRVLLATALMLSALSSCAHQPPPPAPISPSYDDLAMQRYCQSLWDRGYPDDQAMNCRRWYDATMYQRQVRDAQQRDYEESERRRQAAGDALQQMGESMQRNRPTTCTSTPSAIGSSIETTCQ